MAAIIALGMLGLKESLKLPKPFNEDAEFLTEKERRNLGITRLPLTFEERIKVINSTQGQPLRDYFGDELIHNILLVHEADFKFL